MHRVLVLWIVEGHKVSCIGTCNSDTISSLHEVYGDFAAIRFSKIFEAHILSIQLIFPVACIKNSLFFRYVKFLRLYRLSWFSMNMICMAYCAWYRINFEYMENQAEFPYDCGLHFNLAQLILTTPPQHTEPMQRVCSL